MRYHRRHLPSLWREHAQLLRKYGAEQQAAVLEHCADQMEAEETRLASIRISLDEAVEVTGFTRGHLRRLIKDGKLTNLGNEENPEFLFSELPRKPGYRVENKKLASGDDLPANYAWQVARATLFGE